jgi:phage anti-repressor protein
MKGGTMNNSLIKVEKNGVSAYELYCTLKVKTKFQTWFNRRVNDYGFILNQDFVPFLGESTGGRPREDYILSIDTAKELAMVEKTEKGKEVRRYLIQVENIFRSQMVRDSCKVTRRDFTDMIKDTGEDDRMHGFAYPTYTKMIYKKTGINYIKSQNFRDTLTPEQLKAVEGMEKLAEGYLRLGYTYQQIKDMMPTVITEKQDEIESSKEAQNKLV